VIADPWFYVVAVPVVLINGISKGAFGLAMGILGVPVLALVMPIGLAAGVLLPVLMLMDGMAIWIYRGRWSGPILWRVVPGSLLGIAVGAATFHLLSEGAIRLLIGALAVAFTLSYWLRGGAPAPASRPPGWVGVVAGAAAGFTSFVAHTGGLPLSMYLLPQRLEKTVFAATMVFFFTFANAVKLGPYAALGLLGEANLASALLLLPLVPLGVWLGARLHRRLDAAQFYRICYALVLVSGLKLLYDGLAPLLGW
jgi:hypothetical protein